MKTSALIVAALLAAAAAAGPALAADRMFSFSPDSETAHRLTGEGITLVFKTRLVSQTVTRILATAVPATADLHPASERVLNGLKVEGLGQLYAVDTKADQGAAYVRAFCPGATKAWIEFSHISRYPLTVRAFGDDPKMPAAPARLCATMTFIFKGEWTLPSRGPPDPLDDPLSGGGPGGS